MSRTVVTKAADMKRFILRVEEGNRLSEESTASPKAMADSQFKRPCRNVMRAVRYSNSKLSRKKDTGVASGSGLMTSKVGVRLNSIVPVTVVTKMHVTSMAKAERKRNLVNLRPNLPYHLSCFLNSKNDQLVAKTAPATRAAGDPKLVHQS